MDSETKTLLLVLAAVAGGAVLGWCIKQQMRRPRMSTGTGAKAGAAPDDGPSFIAVTSTASPGGDCGCRS